MIRFWVMGTKIEIAIDESESKWKLVSKQT